MRLWDVCSSIMMKGTTICTRPRAGPIDRSCAPGRPAAWSHSDSARPPGVPIPAPARSYVPRRDRTDPIALRPRTPLLTDRLHRLDSLRQIVLATPLRVGGPRRGCQLIKAAGGGVGPRRPEAARGQRTFLAAAEDAARLPYIHALRRSSSGPPSGAPISAFDDLPASEGAALWPRLRRCP